MCASKNGDEVFKPLAMSPRSHLRTFVNSSKLLQLDTKVWMLTYIEGPVSIKVSL